MSEKVQYPEKQPEDVSVTHGSASELDTKDEVNPGVLTFEEGELWFPPSERKLIGENRTQILLEEWDAILAFSAVRC